MEEMTMEELAKRLLSGWESCRACAILHGEDELGETRCQNCSTNKEFTRLSTIIAGLNLQDVVPLQIKS